MFAREPNDLKDYSQVESTSSEPSTENNNAILKRINDMSRIIVPIIKDRSITTQQAQQKKFNAKRNVIETDYPVGTLVMVSDVLKRATTDPSYTGPFTVHSITKRHNYILRDSMNNITNPYPIQRLKLAGGESIPVAKDVSDIYEVQSVVNHKADPTNTRKYIYRVRWKGSPDPSEDTWEEVQHFSSLKPIEEYWNRRNSNYAEPNSKAVITQRKRTASSIPTPDQGAEQGPSTYTRKGKRVRNSTINVADLRKAKLL
jgi:hypothetical protein